jgi:hypothetical protein
MFASLFLFLPIAKADTTGGCGPGSGSTIDATCSGVVTESDGAWSGQADISLTSPFTLNPDDPEFLVNELGSADVNRDQISFSFSTTLGTFSLEDITNNAYDLFGTIDDLSTGTDSITFSLVATEQVFWLAGSPCSTTNTTGCVLTPPPVGTEVTNDLTDDYPPGTVTINYVGDPVVTGLTFDIPAPTPEPSSLLLLCTGILGLGLVALWRKKTETVGVRPI